MSIPRPRLILMFCVVLLGAVWLTIFVGHFKHSATVWSSGNGISLTLDGGRNIRNLCTINDTAKRLTFQYPVFAVTNDRVCVWYPQAQNLRLITTAGKTRTLPMRLHIGSGEIVREMHATPGGLVMNLVTRGGNQKKCGVLCLDVISGAINRIPGVIEAKSKMYSSKIATLTDNGMFQIRDGHNTIKIPYSGSISEWDYDPRTNRLYIEEAFKRIRILTSTGETKGIIYPGRLNYFGALFVQQNGEVWVSANGPMGSTLAVYSADGQYFGSRVHSIEPIAAPMFEPSSKISSILSGLNFCDCGDLE